MHHRKKIIMIQNLFNPITAASALSKITVRKIITLRLEHALRGGDRVK